VADFSTYGCLALQFVVLLPLQNMYQEHYVAKKVRTPHYQ
jgi:hypothetical protein